MARPLFSIKRWTRAWNSMSVPQDLKTTVNFRLVGVVND
jgi:hypothetical protein